jgi:hypothetical protein
MPLSADVQAKLKRPFGKLIQDQELTEQKIRSETNGSQVVATVGDATTDRLVSFGIIPDIAVIDGMERRSSRGLPAGYEATIFRCSNPPGTITKESVDVLRLALSAPRPSRVIVSGEEDLLALPLFSLAPLGSVVIYGQPLEGLVFVKITPAILKEAKDLMDRIGIG